MLTKNALKAAIDSGQRAYGLFCSIPSPSAVELVGEAGFDFVIIDTEHVLVNPETLENMIRAADAVGLTALVRVPDEDAKFILRVLDAGAKGIVVPMVESASQLRHAITAARYHPYGKRSLNGGRAGAFGKQSLADYMDFANGEIMVIAMIESLAGFENIDEILTVRGIDMVLEGAADLSQSLGKPWQISDPEIQAHLHDLQRKCQSAGIPFCAIPREADEHQNWLNRGVSTFVLGDERGIAFRAIKNKIDTTKENAGY
ncbi:HpcH/HpaI aldolase family protein [Thalassospira marina]|uniref:Siderophore biosynthesis protein SbnG n=1 Tax=Thalassospira marina TaxID=2048283 RepID=A0A2N3KTF3_9PROT|nr:aldolase/citrate lyase family protein [Thalassospira marina]PKR53743.1 siderophore biosynthesis protein SbnG [Thalassospira marina]